MAKTIKTLFAVLAALCAFVGAFGIVGTILSVRTPAYRRTEEQHAAVDAWEDLKNYFK